MLFSTYFAIINYDVDDRPYYSITVAFGIE